MFHFYQTADQILTANPEVFPDSADIRWKKLFPLDDEKKYFKVAPAFPNASSAVQWLRSTTEYARQLPSYSRFSRPGYTTATFDKVHESGLGGMNNYGELCDRNGLPVPAILFRGQRSTSEDLLPTLARSLCLHVLLGKGTLKEAINVNETEQECTSFFVSKFFEECSNMPGFGWLAELNMQRRAAIARHHGFYSWIIDYTLDPGVAALFASGGGSATLPREGYGVIYIVDEHDLSQKLQSKPTIINHVGYQERSWTKIKMETVQRNCTVTFGDNPIGTLILPSFWKQLQDRHRALDSFCLRLCFAPGTEAERMWNQKWCGVGATCDDETWTRIITAYQVFARITGCVLFHQTGKVYREPATNITADELLPPDDQLEAAIVNFKNRHGLKPGAATHDFWKRNQ
ncbi:MAG: FRG domain-containing protein [Candidatus Scalindua sp.]